RREIDIQKWRKCWVFALLFPVLARKSRSTAPRIVPNPRGIDPIWGAAREFDFRDEFAADSPLQQTVRVSPDFALLGRKAGLFRGCAGQNRQRGRERPAWRGDMAPMGGNISVGPNFSTAAWMKTVSS